MEALRNTLEIELSLGRISSAKETQKKKKHRQNTTPPSSRHQNPFKQ